MRSPALQTQFVALARHCGVPAAGIAFFRLAAWAQLSGVLAAAGDGFLAASHIVQLLGMVLVLAADHFAHFGARRIFKAAAIATLFTLLGIAVYAVRPGSPAALLLGGAITGAVSSVVVLAWGYYFCSVEPRYSALGLSGGFALYGVLTWVCAGFSAAALTVLALVGPLLSLACLRWGFVRLVCEEPAQKDEPTEDSWLRGVTPHVLAMAAVLGLCMLVNLLGKVLIPLDQEPHALLHRLLWPLLLVVLFGAMLLWFGVGKRATPDGLWPLFVLVIASGLVAYPGLAALDGALASAYLRATQDCLMLFCWVMVASAVYVHGYPRLACFGWSTVVFVKPPLIVSAVLLFLFSGVFANQGESVTMLATGGAAFVLVVAVVLLTGVGSSRPDDAGGETPADDGADRENAYATSLERAACSLRDAYGLTQRETDVAMLLARGNTMVQTAAELHVSLDTVRAHAKGLYRKLGIHKKQELVDRVDGLLRAEGE